MADFQTAQSIIGNALMGASGGGGDASAVPDAGAGGGDVLAQKMDILRNGSMGPLPAPSAPPSSDKLTGGVANLGAGSNEGIAGFLGAPVDAMAWALNKAHDLVTPPSIGDLISQESGASPQRRPWISNPVGGSESIKSAMGYIGADPRNVEASNNFDAMMRGAGAGVTGALLPGGVARGVVASGARLASPLARALVEPFASASPGNLAAIGAAGGAGGEVASQNVPDEYKPLANFVGNLAVGGVTGLGIEAAKGLGSAAGRLASNYLRPFTAAGQERAAGEQLAGAASGGRSGLLDAIDNTPGELVPGSRPTLFQQTGDLGVGGLERARSTQNPEPFLARRAEQNTARTAVVDQLAPEGANPGAVAEHFRNNLAALDASNDAAVNDARSRASSQVGLLGGDLERNEAGAQMRGALADANAAAKADERAKWTAIDPDNSLAVAVDPVKQAATDIPAAMSGSAKPMAGEEAAIFDTAASYPGVVPFRELGDLRSRLLSEIRNERFTNGETPALRRMTQLRQSIDQAMSAGVEDHAATLSPSASGAAGGAVDPHPAIAQEMESNPALRKGYAGLSAEDQARVNEIENQLAPAKTKSGDIRNDVLGADVTDRLVSEQEALFDKGQRQYADMVERRIQGTASPVAAPSAGGSVYTPSGRQIGVKHELTDLAGPNAPITSHTSDLRQNPAYPAELQPRDRGRAASEMQIQNISGNLQPERLGASSSATEGAPIIGPDNVVESGNARTLALAKAYREGGPQSRAYRQWLETQGYDTSGMAAPALVRRRVSDLSPEDRVRFAQEANAGAGLSMSSTERAAQDAGRLSDAVLSHYTSGEISSPENRDFVRAFVASVPERGEVGAIATPDGRLSVEGERRISNALLAKAYDNPQLVQALTERGDENIRAFGAGLTDAAGDLAKLRSDIGAGLVKPEFDIAKPIGEAAAIVQNARAKGIKLGDAVAQTDAFSTISPAAAEILRGAYGEDLTGRVSRYRLASYLRDYAEEAGKQSTEARLFADVVQPTDILARVRSRNGGSAGQIESPGNAPGARPGGTENGQEISGFGNGAPGQGNGSRGASQAQGILPQESLTPNYGPEAQTRYRAAADATRERKSIFNTGRVGETLRAGPNGTPYSAADSAVAAKFFNSGAKGYEDARSFMSALGGSDRARAIAEDYLTSSMRAAAETADGRIDPARLDRWLSKFGEPMRNFPGLADRFKSVGAAERAVDDMVATRAAAHDDYLKGAARHFLNAEPVQAVGKALASAKPQEEFGRLAAAVRGNPDAVAGLRAAVKDYINIKFRSNTEAATSGVPLLKSDRLQSFIKQNRAALSWVYSADQLDNLTALAADLQRANRSIAGARLPGQSNTAQDLHGAAQAGAAHGGGHGPSGLLLGLLMEAGSHHLGGPPLAGIGAALGVQYARSFRDAGISSINSLVDRALLNPELARALIMRASDHPAASMAGQSLLNALRRLSLNGAASSMRGGAAGDDRQAGSRSPSAALPINRAPSPDAPVGLLQPSPPPASGRGLLNVK